MTLRLNRVALEGTNVTKPSLNIDGGLTNQPIAYSRKHCQRRPEVALTGINNDQVKFSAIQGTKFKETDGITSLGHLVVWWMKSQAPTDQPSPPQWSQTLSSDQLTHRLQMTINAHRSTFTRLVADDINTFLDTINSRMVRRALRQLNTEGTLTVTPTRRMDESMTLTMPQTLISQPQRPLEDILLNNLPQYLHLTRLISYGIRQGTYPVNQLLPNSFQVNGNDVSDGVRTRAIHTLMDMGLVEKTQQMGAEQMPTTRHRVISTTGWPAVNTMGSSGLQVKYEKSPMLALLYDMWRHQAWHHQMVVPTTDTLKHRYHLSGSALIRAKNQLAEEGFLAQRGSRQYYVKQPMTAQQVLDHSLQASPQRDVQDAVFIEHLDNTHKASVFTSLSQLVPMFHFPPEVPAVTQTVRTSHGLNRLSQQPLVPLIHKSDDSQRLSVRLNPNINYDVLGPHIQRLSQRPETMLVSQFLGKTLFQIPVTFEPQFKARPMFFLTPQPNDTVAVHYGLMEGPLPHRFTPFHQLDSPASGLDSQQYAHRALEEVLKVYPLHTLRDLAHQDTVTVPSAQVQGLHELKPALETLGYGMLLAH